MRFLVDENIHTRIVAYLRTEGHDVLSVLETFPNANDAAVLSRARNERRVLITHDTDFGELVFRHGLDHQGIILVRPGDERFEIVRDRLATFLSGKTEEEIRSSVWSITL